MATAMQVTVEGEDIGPAEISESAGWITAFSRRKSTSSRQTLQPCNVPRGANKGAAPASVRKRLTAASRLPRLPTEHFRVIVRPRGGLDIKKTGHFKIAQALIAAAGLTSGEVEEDVICPNMIQNIMVASTPSERNAKAYNTVASLIIDNVTYEVNAYMAAPNNTSKGVIRDIDPTLDQDELTRLIVQPRNPTVIGARRIKSTSSVIVLFDGLKVPEYVKCGPSLVKCSLYRRQTDICYACGRLGHRADVCPSPEDGICRGCGTSNPDDQHNCSPKCALCGGNHLTASRDCKRRFQVPYVVRQRRRARRYQKSQEAHDSTGAEPLPPKSATSRRSRSSETRGNRYRVLAEDNSPSPGRASSKDKGRSVSRGRKGYKPDSRSNGRSPSRSRSRSIGRSSSRSRKLSVSIQEPAEQGTGPTWADRVKGQTKKSEPGSQNRCPSSTVYSSRAPDSFRVMSTVAASPRARTRRFKAQLSFGSRSSAQSCLPCNLKANLSELLALLMKPRETVGGGRRRDVPSNATEEIQATPTTTVSDICDAQSPSHSIKPVDENYHEFASAPRCVRRLSPNWMRRTS
ncbi:hypothetical protein HPB52_024880 [Rhipicephalus sanguineus]|uniref:CCHC-type domain-containing protein n=1 Tax=Rhipicephalus sanguineus TaxID=34632 RepID=A0A9D4TDN6_RHISA|nr:hypothetical protein HPB52_024880 [Rhipicephalus sanguineus]